MDVKKIVSFGLCAAMMAGCSSASKTNNVFRYATETDIMSMDPTIGTDGTSMDAMHAINDGLEMFDRNGKVVAGIAESYDLSKDHKTYTFHLRKNVKWVDYQGKTVGSLTAKDFVYGWQRIIKNAGEYAYMLGSSGANIKNADQLINKGTKASASELNTLGVKAKDDYTLVVTLEQQVPFFISLMPFGAFYPEYQKYVEAKGKKYASNYKNLISNGAFIMTGWTKSKSATFIRNKKYWNASAVHLSKMVWQLGLDAKTAAASFDAGNLDYAPLTSSLVDKYKNQKTFTTFADGHLHYLEPNMKNKYLKNFYIRKALSLAINRTELCDKILKDGSTEANGFVPKDLCASPKGVDYRKDVKEDYTTYNLKEAQAAFDKGLKQLGKKSITLSILYGTDEIAMKDVAVYAQSCFSKLKGLKLNMVATVKQDRVNNREPKGQFDITVTRWGPDYADPTTYLNLCETGNTFNRGKWSNKKYDALMNRVRKETNISKRWEDMKEAEKIAMEDYAKIPLFDKGGAALCSTKVKYLVHKPVCVPYTFAYVEMK